MSYKFIIIVIIYWASLLTVIVITANRFYVSCN